MDPAATALSALLAARCPACAPTVLRGVRTCSRCGGEMPELAGEDNPAGPLPTCRRNR